MLILELAHSLLYGDIMKFLAIFFTLFLLSCAQKNITETVLPIHIDPSFDVAVHEGRHLLLFPVILDKRFIGLPSFKELSEPLNIRHDRLELTSYIDYKSEIVDSTLRIRLKEIEYLLLNERSLDIPKKLSYFDSSPLRFLQLFRVRKSFIISGSENQGGKHLTLEGEVWDIRKRGVVWRSSVTIETEPNAMADKEILLRSIELLYETLPKFYFNSTERDW